MIKLDKQHVTGSPELHQGYFMLFFIWYDYSVLLADDLHLQGSEAVQP